MIKTKTIALLGIGILPSALFAQDATTQHDTLAQQEIIPVEIISIRINDKSPFASSNIDAKKIKQQYIGQDIPYLLQQSPSVLVNSDAGNGIGYTDLRVRGTDNSRINFTMNGIPVNDAESQGTFFVNFPDLMSSTNSVQLQRGVGSSTNGSGAFGASVNMSNIQQDDTFSLKINNAFGSFNTWQHMLKVGTGKLSNGFNFDVRLSKQSSDGYIDRAYSDLKSMQFLSSWSSKNKATSLKFNLLTGKEKTGQAWNGVPEDSLTTNRKLNDLGRKADGTYYKDQSDNYQQSYYQLFFNHKLNQKWLVNIAAFLTRGKGFYNEYRLQESFSDYGLTDFISGNDTFTSVDLTRLLWLDNYYYGSVSSANYKHNNTQISMGGSYLNYIAKHYGYVTWAEFGFPNDYKWYNLNADKTDYNFYTKWQQGIGEHLFSFVDLQYRHVSYRINGFRKNPSSIIHQTFSFFNPKAGLSYITSLPGGVTSKSFLSFAIAQKEPNRDDFEAAPNELPQPEKLYNWELGTEFIHQKYKVSINLYDMQYKNQLILSGKINDVGAYTRINVPNSYRMGLEIAAGYTPLPQLNLNANATFSKNKIKEFVEYYDNYDEGGQVEILHKNTDIALSPNTIAALSIAYQPVQLMNNKQNLWLELTSKYVGRQFLDNTSNLKRSIQPYSIFNFKVRYQVTLKSLPSLEIMLAINNIFNKMYESKGYTYSYLYDKNVTTANYYFPQAGRNFMLGINLSW